MSNPNIDVQKYGQSFWYDNIQRALVHNGELRGLIDDFGVLGLTSNPTIFEKAITSGSDYDAQLIELAERGLDAQAIYEALAIDDIRGAADLLRPVFTRTEGVDGFVSLEVSPLLAHDTRGTIAEAHRLFNAVGRPNLMIKVPATPEGIPAVRQLIEDGIHVNVTLIFSLTSYESVAQAYMDGLAARAAKHLPLAVASVASFFVSRLDTLVDHLLDEQAGGSDDRERKRLENMKSKAGIANARLAYEIFERMFAGPAWKALADAGAHPQRVLWASTSTKNPAQPDTYYPDALIGPDTVNTLPPATLKAFRDHGTAAPTLKKGTRDAHKLMESLAEAGVSMAQARQKLLDDGVASFGRSYHGLIAGIEAKRAALLARGRGVGLGAETGFVDEVIKLKAASRVWERDASLWSDEPEHIRIIHSRLGWLSSIDVMRQRADELTAFAAELRSEGFTDAVVLGMGGSSLAPSVCQGVLARPEGGLRLHVLDTTDPTTISGLRDSVDPCRTLFIVASKSGGTIEVTSFYEYFRSVMDECASETAGRHFVAVTDEGTALQSMSQSEGFRHCFLNPGDIGGRYSALSYFGLLPAALMGADVGELLDRAARMAAACRYDSAVNPGLWLGAILGGMALAGRDKVTLIASPQLAPLGAWIEQLLAESTGKRGRGIVPVDGEAAYLKHAPHGRDRLYVHIKLAGDDTHDRLVAGLQRAECPLITLEVADPRDLGAEFFRWEFATAVAGVVLGVNPFDEPNVLESKLNTKRLLDEFVSTGGFGLEATSRSAFGQINKFLRSAKEGDYIALQCYLPYSARIADFLEKLRAAISARYSVPVTLGYGPRFLHSTGQLHKGGAANAVALVLTYDAERDLAIPGEPYSFGTLIRAQALGDFESLRSRERRVMRIHLMHDPTVGLRKIAAALKPIVHKDAAEPHVNHVPAEPAHAPQPGAKPTPRTRPRTR